ncbi:MAG: hypothetical protein PHQ12_14475 [Chthoniobacteraceae bacterium]|nr:hypothetical protein [Chthoniobacteraceae bacterium]
MQSYLMQDGSFNFFTARHDEGGWHYIFRVPAGHNPKPWIPVLSAANSSVALKLPDYRAATEREVQLWMQANPRYLCEPMEMGEASAAL